MGGGSDPRVRREGGRGAGEWSGGMFAGLFDVTPTVADRMDRIMSQAKALVGGGLPNCCKIQPAVGRVDHLCLRLQSCGPSTCRTISRHGLVPLPMLFAGSMLGLLA